MSPNITVNVSEYIAANKYNVDEENVHIGFCNDDLDQLDDAEFGKLVACAPPPSTRLTPTAASPSTTPAASSVAPAASHARGASCPSGRTPSP